MKRNNFNIGGLIVLIILLLFPAVFLVPVFFDSKMDSDVKILWSILALIIISVEIIGLIRNKNKITSNDNLNKSSNTNIVPNESNNKSTKTKRLAIASLFDAINFYLLPLLRGDVSVS